MAKKQKMTAPPIDCKCTVIRHDKRGRPIEFNEGKQNIRFVHALPSGYKILQFIGIAAAKQTFGVIHDGDSDNAVRRDYKFGGEIEYQCVHPDDITDLMKRNRGGRPLFRIWTPRPVRGKKAVKVKTEVVDDPAAELGGEPIDAPSDDEEELGEYAYSDKINDLTEIQGVGHATAKKFVEAGYDINSLAELDDLDDGVTRPIAEKANVPNSMVILAIEGAKEWAAVVKQGA